MQHKHRVLVNLLLEKGDQRTGKHALCGNSFRFIKKLAVFHGIYNYKPWNSLEWTKTDEDFWS